MNYDHDLHASGEYNVNAYRRVPFGDGDTRFNRSQRPSIEVRNQIWFRIDENAKLDPKTLKDLVDQLNNAESSTRIEAARTLASVAPTSMESVLLGFGTRNEFSQFAPLAFHRLHTKRGTAALGEFLAKSRPHSPESLERARYLGESGDPQWFPILRDLSRQNQSGGEYLYPAAESGGDEAVPFLVDKMRAPDAFSVSIAISALAYTGSRDAVPVLLETLRSASTDSAGRALYGLERLTHFKVGAGDLFANPQAQYDRWSRWWAQSKNTARIYKAGECGEFAPLP